MVSTTMNKPCCRQALPMALGLLIVILVAGCGDAPGSKSDRQIPKATSPSESISAASPATKGTHDSALAANPPADPAKSEKVPPPPWPAGKGTEVGKNVFLQIDGDKRRVLINTVVCLRMGLLEQFMCKAMTKEHESILAADIDARRVHFALIAAGAEPGSPVKFQPKYTPASGSVIKVYVQYQVKGKTIKLPAQQWVRNIKTGKELAHDWVFAGSRLFSDPSAPKAPPYYGANEGDVICLSNFEVAMMDLPIESSADNDDLDFEAFTDRIPAEGTNVLVILEPVLAAKKS